MKFDYAERFLENTMFEYVDDPVIESVESGVASHVNISEGVPPGGIKISVVGKNFGYIQKPQMYVLYKQKIFISVI